VRFQRANRQAKRVQPPQRVQQTAPFVLSAFAGRKDRPGSPDMGQLLLHGDGQDRVRADLQKKVVSRTDQAIDRPGEEDWIPEILSPVCRVEAIAVEDRPHYGRDHGN